MLVFSSEGKTVFIGILQKWKKGRGEAEEKLTIATLKSLTMPGDKPTNEVITVLCWNYLSKKVRKMSIGQVVVVQVAFEAGHSMRGTAERMPKSGLFRTRSRQELLVTPISHVVLEKEECFCVGEVWSKHGLNWTYCYYTEEKAVEAKRKIVPGDSLLCYCNRGFHCYLPYATQVVHNGRQGESL